MKSGGRTNALLMELLIVIFFFMISACILVRIFAAAHNKSDRSGREMQVLAQAQNMADALYASEDAEGTLKQLGFNREQDLWVLEQDGCRYEVVRTPEVMTAGTFFRTVVKAYLEDRAGQTEEEPVLSLPCSRYLHQQELLSEEAAP